MAICTHHIACRACGSRDNRGVYDDGSEWCFGCHDYVPATLSGFVKAARHETEDEKTWTLPDDLTQDFPEDIINYVNKYSITVAELLQYGYFYSRRTGRLWRLFFDDNDQQLQTSARRSHCAAEARRSGGANGGPKSLFFGSKEDATAIAGTQRPCAQLVLVEDSLSSIKVGRVVHAAPLFGTSLSMGKLMKFVAKYQRVTVWLDHDKFKEAWEIALKFKWLGIQTNVVLTQHDPKCYNEDEIRNYLR